MSASFGYPVILTGIPENETADKATKEACDMPPFTRGVTSMDPWSYMKHMIYEDWPMEWYGYYIINLGV